MIGLTMRASLNFTLPDDQAAFDAALLGRRALSVLAEVDRRCRDAIKHGGLTLEEQAVIQDIRNLVPIELLEA